MLIGTTAAGLGSRFTAPLGTSARPISSVEMLAHVLNGSLQGSHAHPASATLNRALNAAAVLLALLALACCSVLTAPLGARAAHRLPVGQLKRIFATLLFGLAAYMLWKGLSAGS